MPSDIPITVRGQVDDRAVEQLKRCVAEGDAVRGVLCADGHVGYSMPIGGAIAYEEHISPSGVGYDIGCLAAGTPVTTAAGYTISIEDAHAGQPIVCWDGTGVRPVDPSLGPISRGVKETWWLRLAGGREVRLTGDHLVRTPEGWCRADELEPGALVACPVLTGLRFEEPPADLAVGALPHPTTTRSHLDREADLRARGLWPVSPQDQRFPALLRVLAYALGDGHLSTNGKTLSIWTTVREDAADLRADIAALGFTSTLHVRARGPRRRDEILVRTGSVSLCALLSALGLPAGKKVETWPADGFDWLFALPAWQRAVFLSAFASAEATTPALLGNRATNIAIKQAGRHPHAIRFVQRLIESLGFRTGMPVSGPVRAGVTTHVVQILGGEAETLRFFAEVGFNRAAEKRVAAARVASVVWQVQAARQRRLCAYEEARALVGTGVPRADPVFAVTAMHDVSPSFVHHAISGFRGVPRAPKGLTPAPRHDGEVAWTAVASLDFGGEAEVFDIVTGDPAESFVAGGVCVHNCGNKAVRTDVKAEDIADLMPSIMDEVQQRISFGMGRVNEEPVDHEVLDEIFKADFKPQRKLVQSARNQLGTVGAGNHYVNLMEDEDGWVWVGVHFGSRGFGHKTASGFLAMAEGKQFDEHATEGEMDSPPVLFHQDSEIGASYIAAMQLAGRYAYAGRDVVVDKVLEILGASSTYEVHNHHNFAWREDVGGKECWVVRKGCTPAFPGQAGFVGATMGEPSVVLEGVASDGARELLNSTVHGAGRVMSRTQAAGKVRRRKKYACAVRGCPRIFSVDGVGPNNPAPKKGLCPEHPDAKVRKVFVAELVRPGKVDWASVQEDLKRKGIELRGGAADEAPEAYKRLDDVLAAHADSIRVLHRLKPLGVAMAGADVYDPYKD